MKPELLYVIESRMSNRGGRPSEWNVDFNIPEELQRQAYSDSIEQVFGIIFNDKDDAKRFRNEISDLYPAMGFRVRSCLVIALPTKDLKIATYGVAPGEDDD